MTKPSYDINAVTRMLEERENDLQVAVSLGHTLLENNDSLHNQVILLEQDIEHTTEIVKQLKYDLLLKERLIRFYSDIDLEISSIESNQLEYHHYEQKIRNLEHENLELRAESIQLKLESEKFEHQEQVIVDHFTNALANANSEIENLQEEFIRKNEENLQQEDELVHLSHEMHDIHHRLKELKHENEELKILLSLTGKTCQEYETKIEDLKRSYSECLSKLRQSQQEINFLKNDIPPTSPLSSMLNINSNHRTVFLSPVEYANYMSLENSLQSELEEVLEDPNQLCPSTIRTNKKIACRRIQCDQINTDEDSSIDDSAYSDTESLQGTSLSYHFCQHLSPIRNDRSKSMSSKYDRKLSREILSRLKLVKRLEGSKMLKRWQELAEPSLSACLQSIPGVYTRAEILCEINEENFETPQNELEDRQLISFEKHSPETPIYSYSITGQISIVDLLNKQGITARTVDSTNSFSEFERKFLTCPLPNRSIKSTIKIIADPDEFDDEPITPLSSPIHGAQLQTSALLNQVIQCLVKLSLHTFETLTTPHNIANNQTQVEKNDEKTRLDTISTITPPSSPTFDGLAAPTPNTAIHAIKTSTFLRASSLNPLTNKSIRTMLNTLSPEETPSIMDGLIRNHLRRI